MIELLLELDQKAFLFLNGINSPMWDDIMWVISAKYTWIPLYVMLLIVMIYKELSYRVVFTILFAIITVTLCDQISVFVKLYTERPRPTHAPEIAELVHTVNNYRGGRFGFFSSHAANTFGAAAFISNQFKNNKWGLFLFGWAAVVSYSRIYLGVHYPLDIICGSLAGVLIGVQCYVFKVYTSVYFDRKIEERNKKKKIRKS